MFCAALPPSRDFDRMASRPLRQGRSLCAAQSQWSDAMVAARQGACTFEELFCSRCAPECITLEQACGAARMASAPHGTAAQAGHLVGLPPSRSAPLPPRDRPTRRFVAGAFGDEGVLTCCHSRGLLTLPLDIASHGAHNEAARNLKELLSQVASDQVWWLHMSPPSHGERSRARAGRRDRHTEAASRVACGAVAQLLIATGRSRCHLSVEWPEVRCAAFGSVLLRAHSRRPSTLATTLAPQLTQLACRCQCTEPHLPPRGFCPLSRPAAVWVSVSGALRRRPAALAEALVSLAIGAAPDGAASMDGAQAAVSAPPHGLVLAADGCSGASWGGDCVFVALAETRGAWACARRARAARPAATPREERLFCRRRRNRRTLEEESRAVAEDHR